MNQELIDFSKKYLNRYKFDGPIVVTGATGLIGRSLIQAVEVVNPDIEIYALCRNEEKLRTQVSKKAHFVYYDLMEPVSLQLKHAHIIHCAAPTSSHDFYHKANEVFDQILVSTQYVAEYAKEYEAKNLIYLSTLEIYGETSETNKMKEHNYHGLDPLNPRNSYALAKLAAENRLSFYFKDSSIPVTILRLSQVLGIPSSYDDNRVIFYFARQVLEEKNIELQTSGSTVRNYIHYLDLIEVLFIFLADTEDKFEVYNVAHPSMEVSIRDLAQKFIDVTKSQINLDYVDQKTAGYRDDLYLVLDVQKLLDKGWSPKFDLVKSIESLLMHMNHQRKNILKDQSQK